MCDAVAINIVNEKDVEKTDKSCTMQRFLCMAVHGYEPFGKGIKNVMIGSRIVERINEANGKLELEDEDYKMLWKAVDAMTLNPVAAQKCLVFYEAVDNVK